MDPDTFWKKLAVSKLLGDRECERARAQAHQHSGEPDEPSAEEAARYLVSKALLTRYQASALLSDKSIPFFVGAYVLQERVSTGKWKGHWLALHRASGQRVLLFTLPKRWLSTAGEAALAAQRIQAIQRVKHPHLWRLYEVVESQGTWFLVTEWRDGQALSEYVATTSPIPAELACTWLLQIALALVAYRAADPGPRMVSLDQVWVDDAQILRLLPFPLAGDSEGIEASATAPFLAPELREKSSATAESDRAFPPVIDISTAPGKRALRQEPIPKLPVKVGEEALNYSLGRLLASCLVESAAVNSTTETAAGGSTKLKLRADVPGRVKELLSLLLKSAPDQRLPTLEDCLSLARAAGGQRVAPPVPVAAQLSFERWLDEHGTASTGLARLATLPEPETTSAPTLIPDVNGSSSKRKQTAVASKKRSWASLAMGALAIAAAGILGWVLKTQLLSTPGPVTQPSTSTAANRGQAGNSSQNLESSAADESAVPEQGSEPEPAVPKPVSERRFELVADDGRSLWAPPTQGPTWAWEQIPPGAAFVGLIRPRVLLGTEQGRAFIQLAKQLGWDWEGIALQHGWDALSDVDEMWWSVHPNASGLVTSLKLVGPVGYRALHAEPGSPHEVGEERYYEQSGKGVWSPRQAPHVLVITDPKLLSGFLKEADSQVAPRDFALLVNQLDQEQAAGCLFLTQLLEAEARDELSGPGEPLRELAQRLALQGVRAVYMGTSFTPTHDYVEFQCSGDSSVRGEELREGLAAQWGTAGPNLATWLAQPSTAEFATYPLLLQQLAQFTRWQAKGNQAVANFYGPAGTVRQLVSGGAGLLMARAGTSVPLARTETAPEAASVPVLERKISLKFRQESFEAALELLCVEANCSGEILGTDLQLEGITKNQPIRDFNVTDLSLEQALLQLLKQANKDGKLVFVELEPGKITVSTRAAALERKWTLRPSLLPELKPKGGKP